MQQIIHYLRNVNHPYYRILYNQFHTWCVQPIFELPKDTRTWANIAMSRFATMFWSVTYSTYHIFVSLTSIHTAIGSRLIDSGSHTENICPPRSLLATASARFTRAPNVSICGERNWTSQFNRLCVCKAAACSVGRIKLRLRDSVSVWRCKY